MKSSNWLKLLSIRLTYVGTISCRRQVLMYFDITTGDESHTFSVADKIHPYVRLQLRKTHFNPTLTASDGGEGGKKARVCVCMLVEEALKP